MTVDNKKQAFQATALIIGKILASLSDAIIPIILVRFLPMNEVGLLSAVPLIYTILAPIFATAFPGALMYFLPTREPSAKKAVAIKIALIMSALGAVAGLIMLLMGIIALVFPDILATITDNVVGGISAVGPSGLKYLIVLAIFPLGDFPARMLPNLLIIEDKAKTAATVSVIKSILTVLSILVPVLCHFNLWIIIASYSLSGLLYGLFLLYYLATLFPQNRRKRLVADVTTRQIMRFAIPMGIAETVMLLYNKIDQFLIALAFTASMVAQYKIGAWQIPFITSIAYSVGSVYAPHLRRLLSEGKAREAIGLWRLSIQKVSLISVPLGLIFVVGAEELIELLFTGEYLRAANIFRLYCILTVGRVAAFGTVLVAAGRPRLIFRVATLRFIANILFSVPAMFLIGLEGPAVGTVLAFIIHVCAFCWCIAEATGLHFQEIFPLKTYLKTLAIGLTAAACALIFKLSVTAGAGFKLAGITVIMLSLFSLIGTASGQIKKEDWNFIGQFLFRSLSKKKTGNE